MANNEIMFNAETGDLTAFLEQLELALADATAEVRELALDFLEGSAELVRVENGMASGAMVALLFKPSQRLLDLDLAVRTGDFDSLIVKYGHGAAPVVDDNSSNAAHKPKIFHFHINPLTYEGVRAAAKQGVEDAKLSLGIGIKGVGEVEREVDHEEIDEP